MFQHSARRPGGVILVDGQEVADTLQCCHCGRHFRVVKGSGRKRGFCMKCMSVTCGSEECSKCVPFEERLEMIEAGQ